MGFSRANNLGVHYSRKFFKSCYAIFSNNDISIDSNTFNLETFVDIFNNHVDCAVIGPCVRDLNNKPQSPKIKEGALESLFLEFWNYLLLGHLNNRLSAYKINEPTQLERTYWVSGCFMIADIEKFTECNGFDENVFLYGEERILAERLERKGYYMYYFPGTRIIHQTSVTTKRFFSQKSLLKFDFESRLYYFKHYRNISRLVILLAELNFGLYNILVIFRRILQKFYHAVKAQSPPMPD